MSGRALAKNGQVLALGSTTGCQSGGAQGSTECPGGDVKGDSLWKQFGKIFLMFLFCFVWLGFFEIFERESLFVAWASLELTGSGLFTDLQTPVSVCQVFGIVD